MTDKTYKITWDEKEDGDCYWSKQSKRVEAESEDAACDWWTTHIEPYIETTGIDDCVLIVETPLFDKKVLIDMPDGLTYMIPVEFIARKRARYYFNKGEFPTLEDSLLEDTIPLMESEPYEIEDWARNNLNWDDVEFVAVALKKKAKQGDFQEAWLNNTMEIK